MKRIIFFILLIGSFLSSFAAGYNARQEALRTDIENYLKNEGFTVERENDGLKFMSDGNTYYIEIDKTELNPMYVRLVRFVKFDDKLNRDNVMKKLNVSNNNFFAVKVLCKEKNLILSSEMYVTSAEQFNYAFKDLLSLMKEAYVKIK